MSKIITGSIITVAATAILACAPTFARAQSAEAPEKEHQHMHGQMQGGDETVEAQAASGCERMQAKMKNMRATMEKNQAELDALVERVQSTTGETQQAAIAELLTRLVEQRRPMTEMMAMQPGMMHSMSPAGMADCPMMQKMKSDPTADEPAADTGDHSQHH